ncbi:hypothetical protein [Actinokineospora sp. NBRC 105648]|uniref:hypothetical protein n=1 Tax=Actinokineospora sp. NBRC 105648 TaxID=3032206 RepID=UPI0024A0FAFD|nr:hypothetical protein [Actinokineospora sp. NBRC 105648]GLZ38229.1 hypothetical protein Acsp05_18530 [Actinokineospora sp. NBRC 105648]
MTEPPDWLVPAPGPPPDRRRARRLLVLTGAALLVAAGATWAVALAGDDPGVVVCSTAPDLDPAYETLIRLVSGSDC